MKEHSSCYNYTRCIQEGFLYHKFCDMEIDKWTNEFDYILFVMEGEADISCDGEELKLLAGHMICLDRQRIWKVSSQGKGSMVIAQFDNAVQSCDKVSFSQLNRLSLPQEQGMYPLEIKDRLQLFLKLLIAYLEDGAGCVHFHEIKLKELFLNIRFYYTKSQQAAFFRPLLGNDYEFRKAVLKNYKESRTVKQLAGLCQVSLSSFKRKFSEEFKEAPHDWLQKQINNMIKHELVDENRPIGDIADQLHFSSQSQFCKYCKRNLGYTPEEWRKLQENRSGTPKGFSGNV